MRAASDWCGRLGARLVPYPDSTFAYSTQRSLTIKDWRLGAAGLVLKFGIFCYIIIYQVIFQQVYRRDSAISVSLRTRTLAGTAPYSWTNGQAPYCLGVTTPQHQSALLASYYEVNAAAGTYRYTGPGGSLCITECARAMTSAAIDGQGSVEAITAAALAALKS